MKQSLGWQCFSEVFFHFFLSSCLPPLPSFSHSPFQSRKSQNENHRLRWSQLGEVQLKYKTRGPWQNSRKCLSNNQAKEELLPRRALEWDGRERGDWASIDRRGKSSTGGSCPGKCLRGPPSSPRPNEASPAHASSGPIPQALWRAPALPHPAFGPAPVLPYLFSPYISPLYQGCAHHKLPNLHLQPGSLP